MTQQDYDIVAEGKKHINAPFQKCYEQAKAVSEAGKLKLVSEYTLQPYNGHGFKIDKGQVVRYELIGGAQTIDLFYMVRSRPTEEWADEGKWGQRDQQVESDVLSRLRRRNREEQGAAERHRPRRVVAVHVIGRALIQHEDDIGAELTLDLDRSLRR